MLEAPRQRLPFVSKLHNRSDIVASISDQFCRAPLDEACIAREIRSILVTLRRIDDLPEHRRRSDCFSTGKFGHSLRTADYAKRLSELAGVSPEDQVTIQQAGLVHDCGVVLVSDHGLSRQDHPITGAVELARRGFPTDFIAITLQHHERPDGSGYPYGLTQAEYHPLAGLFRYVDVFDSMVSSGKKPEWAFSEIRKKIGRDFDIRFAEAFAEFQKEFEATQGMLI